jgi:sulfotransferase family protein
LPGEIHRVTDHLNRDQLMERASRQTGLDDFGDIPFLEPLDVLLYSLVHDAKVEGVVRDGAADMLTGVLSKRLMLVNDRKVHPEIAREVITAPIVIVGQPRSGSTHLHALLACVDGLRAPLFWEMSSPSPPPQRETFGSDPRIAMVQQFIDGMPSELLVRHPMAATRPEQCNLLNDWSFVNQAWLASYDIPTYRDWFLDADYGPAYEAHRRTLQHLQWRNPGRWVLKYPKHLLSCDALLATYPDASLVWTHRDPATVVPSVVSLTGYMRESNTPEYDRVRFGREWVSIEELSLHRGLAVRDGGMHPDVRNFDLHYPDLMRDEMGAVETVCAQVGVPFGGGSRARVGEWIDDHPKTKHGVHRYAAQDFGLDQHRLRARFAFYSRRFGIEPEVKS